MGSTCTEPGAGLQGRCQAEGEHADASWTFKGEQEPFMFCVRRRPEAAFPGLRYQICLDMSAAC